MHSISRRGFVISAATAGAAFGLDGPLEFIGSAFAQSNPALLEKGFVKFKVGDVEVTQIYDGIWNRERRTASSRMPRWRTCRRPSRLPGWPRTSCRFRSRSRP